MDVENGYPWVIVRVFLYPHVNGAGTNNIVFVPVDTCTRYTLFKLKKIKKMIKTLTN